MKILIVEDDLNLREAIVDSLEMKNHEVSSAPNGLEALAMINSQSFELVLSDINMPSMDGIALLKQLKTNHPWLPVVLMTAFGDVNQAVQAMQMGANDYLMKPFELKELDNLLASFNQQDINHNADQPVSESQGARQLFQLAQRVAKTDSTVLISGESGTGKEVLARYVHQHSNRYKGPFVAINCAAIPENMLEAILFGYEKGAYTGAYQATAGKFEQANGGTLLLDEISEMDISLQAKLLRVLQEQQVERLGGKKAIELDVRIIATTNRELANYVGEGKFREDLYYRLSVFPLQWLPLRQRTEDIVPLAERLLAHHALKMKRPVPQLQEDAKQFLVSHSWPGNVRELDNSMQRALIIQSGPKLYANDILLTPVPNKVAETTVAQSMASLPAEPESESVGELGNDLKNREVELIIRALKEESSKQKAADRLGVSPRTLRYKMARLREEGINIDDMLQTA